MPTPNRPLSQNKFPEQYMENSSYDTDFNVLTRLVLGHDGQNLQRQDADNLGITVQVGGSDTYIGEAAPGTTLATAKWKAYKVDSSGSLTFADGDANFNNVATDLTALSYS